MVKKKAAYNKTHSYPAVKTAYAGCQILYVRLRASKATATHPSTQAQTVLRPSAHHRPHPSASPARCERRSSPAASPRPWATPAAPPVPHLSRRIWGGEGSRADPQRSSSSPQQHALFLAGSSRVPASTRRSHYRPPALKH